MAQLDSASDSDSEGRRFESYRAGQNSPNAACRIGTIFTFSKDEEALAVALQQLSFARDRRISVYNPIMRSNTGS